MVSFVLSLATFIASTQAAEITKIGDDASLYCLDDNNFCQRTREWKIDQNDASSPKDIGYASQIGASKVDGSKVNFKLDLNCDQDSGYLATELHVELEFY